MTKKELSINTKWDEFEIGTCRLFVPVLNQYLTVLFFQDHKPKPTISSTMLQAVNDILAMDKREFERIGELLNIKTYKIKEIHIDQDNDVYEGRYSEVIVTTDPSTQVSIIVKDGKFLCLNDGTYFDTLEVVEKQSKGKSISKEEKEKIVAMMLSSE